MISSIFACTFREAISVLTERAPPLRRSLNRADAEKRADLAPLRRSQRHSERLDLSLVAFLGKQKVAMGVYKGVKCR